MGGFSLVYREFEHQGIQIHSAVIKHAYYCRSHISLVLLILKTVGQYLRVEWPGAPHEDIWRGKWGPGPLIPSSTVRADINSYICNYNEQIYTKFDFILITKI